MKTYHDPPNWPLRILRSISADLRAEEIEGDLFERYNEVMETAPEWRANLYYLIWVIRASSYARKSDRLKPSQHSRSLFIHHVKVAFRNLMKNKTTSLINVLGMVIGLAVFTGIARIVQHELSYNRSIPDYHQINRLFTGFADNDIVMAGVPSGTARYLLENRPEVEDVSLFFTATGSVEVSSESEPFEDISLVIADTNYFKLFKQYEWLAGSAGDFARPNAVVLSRAQAEKYFTFDSLSQVIGASITYGDTLNGRVVGIVEWEGITDFNFHNFVSAQTLGTVDKEHRFSTNRWTNISSSTQVWFRSDISSGKTELLADLNNQLDQERDGHPMRWVIDVQPLSQLHFDPSLSIFDYATTAPVERQTLWLMMLIGIAILTMAIFNFINLEIAQSLRKSKEVGVRKTIGTSHSQLMARFMTESWLLTLFSGLCSLPVIYYGTQLFTNEMPFGQGAGMDHPYFWILLFTVLALTALLSGLYPAVVLSRFQVGVALKANSSLNSKSTRTNNFRRSLIGLQFLFSQVLIIMTLVVFYQLNFVLNKDLGFERENILYFYTPRESSLDDRKLFINELEQIPGISELSLHSYPPAQRGWASQGLRHMKNGEEIVMDAHVKHGDSDYLDFYGIDLVAGRRTQKRDTLKEVVVNQALVKSLGYQDPSDLLNQKINDYYVVGVMADIHFQSLHNSIKPLFIIENEQISTCVAMKVMPGAMSEIIEKTSSAINRIFPEATADIRFLDETIERYYRAEQRLSGVMTIATGTAILLSCLGLYGLISLVIVQKSKEVGIRKILGASMAQLGYVLSREFLFLLLLALLFSLPVSIFLAREFISSFAYQAILSWWIFAVGGVCSFLVAGASVGYRIWRVSGANPVESLRYE